MKLTDQIDPSEAPIGYTAVKFNGTCSGCALEDKKECDWRLCCLSIRADRQSVKFKETAK